MQIDVQLQMYSLYLAGHRLFCCDQTKLEQVKQDVSNFHKYSPLLNTRVCPTISSKQIFPPRPPRLFHFEEFSTLDTMAVYQSFHKCPPSPLIRASPGIRQVKVHILPIAPKVPIVPIAPIAPIALIVPTAPHVKAFPNS